MFDIVEDVAPWCADQVEFAIATVTRTWSSAPRMVGAAMALSAHGEVIGSVSGGCVEGAVLEVCQEVLRTGVSAQVKYGVSNEDAFDVGLTCGGTIELFVRKVSKSDFPEFETIIDLVRSKRAFSIATELTESGAHPYGLFIGDQILGPLTQANSNLKRSLQREIQGLTEAGKSKSIHVGNQGELDKDELTFFVNVFNAPAHMVVFGAIDFAAAVAGIGKFLGYYVTVCDARETFATKKRFPAADEVVVDWPHRYLERTEINSRTVICVLTHDPKFDIPALKIALRSSAAYVGAMGSHRTHMDRLERLREAGMSQSELDRLRSPIGLDLNAHTPEETAVAIAAEIVADFWGGSKQSLSEREFTTIHKESLASERA